jgi:hypothetical protein
VAVVLAASRIVERPSGLAGTILWWISISATATAVMVLLDRILRRFMPLAALLELSLVFPDHAPSRFKLALRSGTVKQFQRQLESGRAPTTQEAAETLLALAARLGDHDRLTRGHSERVRAYSDLIAEELGLDDEARQKLHWSALLHDIGKLTVPSEILNKPGAPDDDEWQILKRHPGEADTLLAPLAGWLGDWRFAAMQHHERWDGAGYPEGLNGAGITLAGRIVAVADAFDTITSVRSYKKAMTADEARTELTRCAGAQFDPTVVRAFLGVSLGRLRLVMGPFSWLAHSPILAGVPAAGSAAASTAGATVVTAAMLAAGVVPVAEPTPVEMVAPTVQAPDDLAFQLPAPLVPTPDRTDTSGSTPPPPETPTATPTATTREPTPTPTSWLVAPDAGPTATPWALPDEIPTPTPATPWLPTPTPATPWLPTPTPTATPWLPTPTPTPTPWLPTETPTATPKPATPTTTPKAPEPISALLYLTNPGAGDTVSSPVLALSEYGPTGSVLPNYDTDRDGAEGLLVRRGDGTSERDPEKRQYWSFTLGEANAPGSVDLTIYAATRDYLAGRQGIFRFSVERCDETLSDCAVLGSGEGSFTQPSAASFTRADAIANVSGGTTRTQPVLLLVVAPISPSDEDLWFAYDTALYPATLKLDLG